MLVIVYWPTKDPAASIDYGIDYGPLLGQLGDPPPIIVNSDWQVVQGAITLPVDIIDDDDRGTTVRVAGGVDGTEAIAKNIVTLSDGQVFPVYCYIKIRTLA